MKLYNGDCHIVLKKLEDNSIDHFIFDLPYNVLDDEWDKNIIDLELMWSEIKRIKKLRKSNIIMFCDMRLGAKLINSNPSWFRYSMVWKKNNCSFLSHKKKPSTDHELILLFSSDDDDVKRVYNLELRLYAAKVRAFINKPMATIFEAFGNKTADHFLRTAGCQFGLCTEDTYNKLIDLYKINKMYKFKTYSELEKIHEPNKKLYNETKINDKLPQTVLCFDIVPGIKRHHPIEKPQPLLEWLISSYTNKNDSILDITMGCGALGVACSKLDRDFIGIEQDKKYYETACDRLIK